MPTSPLQQPFCTTREAAALLGVSLRTAQLWSESGLLTAWKTSGGHRRITLESVEKLRAKADFAPVAALQPEVQSPAAPFHILVAEDDPIFQELYRAMIGSWAMQPKLTLAGNGFDALVRIGETHPDLLISDLDMPGMDGFEMLRTLKSMPALARLKMIVVTGLTDAEIEQRGGLPAGVPVLHKPIQFERLEFMAEACRSSRATAARASH